MEQVRRCLHDLIMDISSPFTANPHVHQRDSPVGQGDLKQINKVLLQTSPRLCLRSAARPLTIIVPGLSTGTVDGPNDALSSALYPEAPPVAAVVIELVPDRAAWVGLSLGEGLAPGDGGGHRGDETGAEKGDHGGGLHGDVVGTGWESLGVA